METTLLTWFDVHGRELPWRRTRDPYAILVAEVMLQQTQVDRVLPRYVEWLERWPSAETLAAAPLGDVIRAWQGLGYNRRAVNLHRAAKRIALGGWPSDLTELPGVGRYTADAVACFAFGEPVLPVDTNVRRVLARSGGSFGARSAEALMDLGATVCLARIPRCSRCPLARACPSAGSRYQPLRKQAPFAGSFRERRARALRLIAKEPRPVQELDRRALDALERDGLVQVANGVARLPG
ncbi:MAG: A/G-specific adenine glycosylase [Actinomycetota bacterium]|nr:A/G-specific adenine glycosylase [Actinomycetota bacterium]